MQPFSRLESGKVRNFTPLLCEGPREGSAVRHPSPPTIKGYPGRSGSRSPRSRPVRSGTGAILILLCLAACAPSPGKGVAKTGGASQPSIRTFQGLTMGTEYHVAYVSVRDGAPEPRAVRTAVEAVLREVNHMASTYDEKSEISRFNRHAGLAPFPVSTDLAALVQEALDVAHLTEGAFDPTVLPAVRLLGFGPGKAAAFPSPGSLQAIHERVGYGKVAVEREGPCLRRNRPAVELDLSGIAKGYAVDRVGERLSALGIRAWMVEIGGEVKVHGGKPGNRPWTVGVETPLPDLPFGGRILRKISLREGALATSGDYRNFREEGNRRVHHILDPRTLANPANDLASVTVIAPRCALADALATGFMVWGEEKGKALAGRLPGVEALFVHHRPDGTFRVTATRGFPGRGP